MHQWRLGIQNVQSGQSADHDPLFRFHRCLANLGAGNRCIVGVDEHIPDKGLSIFN